MGATFHRFFALYIDSFTNSYRMLIQHHPHMNDDRVDDI